MFSSLPRSVNCSKSEISTERCCERTNFSGGGGGGSKGGKKSLSRTQDVLKVSLLNFDLIVKIPI